MGTRQKKSNKQEGKDERKQRAKSSKTIVRIAGKDIDGSFTLPVALRQIKGIGHNLADTLSKVIIDKLSMSKGTTIGELNEEQLKIVEQIIKHPEEFGVPSYLINFRKNPNDGKNVHLISNDLVITMRNIIQKERAMKTWRGYRHGTRKGKVRGQKTRRTGRRGLTVGVIRKKMKPAAGKAASK
ncbi:30S ribosomal protein S13 [Candidatus Micrarchaeota archaeon]|nr:30S ribosomal protein S13 [Candidatus Micrarchaeota archaeon]